MNKDIKTSWDQIKNKTQYDFFSLVVAKAVKSKQNDKFGLFKELIKTSFTPVTNTNKLDNGCTPWQAIEHMVTMSIDYVMDRNVFSTFSDAEKLEGIELMKQLRDEMKTERKYYKQTLSTALEDNTYVYFFTRQDISQEQQLVQTAHAAACSARDNNYNPHTQHFIVFGVPDKETLLARENWLHSKGINLSRFYEPDYALGLTSFATEPMKKSMALKKKLFNGESLLTF